MAITDQYTNPAESFEENMRNLARRLTDRMYSNYESALSTFWTSPNLHPQSASAALGTDAQELFSFFADTKTVVQTYRPGLTFTPVSYYGSISYVGDGSVTVTDIKVGPHSGSV